MKKFIEKKSKKGVAPTSKGIVKKKKKSLKLKPAPEDNEANEDSEQDENEVAPAPIKSVRPVADDESEGDEDEEYDGGDEDVKDDHDFEDDQNMPSDDDSEDDEDQAPPAKKKQPSEETAAEKTSKGKEYSVFVGNLPPTITLRSLKSMFKPYGTIQTLRIRNADGQRVFYKKDLKNVKSLIAFVRFSSKEEVQAACAENGKMIGDNRIRVCPHDQKQIGSVKATVFVGNIHKGTTENELYDFFSRAGDIEYIRQIENKCIAYVCFKSSTGRKKALKMDREKLNNRPLRIQEIDTQRSNWRLNKKGHVVKKNQLANKSGQKANAAGGDKGKKNVSADFHGTVTNEKSKNKKGQSFKSGKGSVKHKKMLAGKLKAAMVRKPIKA
uniref:RRM domain-containing protein n=1 Tax=Anopheles farauti TaxID=69004 RepID=A0A182Q8T7_9DIPT